MSPERNCGRNGILDLEEKGSFGIKELKKLKYRFTPIGNLGFAQQPSEAQAPGWFLALGSLSVFSQFPLGLYICKLKILYDLPQIFANLSKILFERLSSSLEVRTGLVGLLQFLLDQSQSTRVMLVTIFSLNHFWWSVIFLKI